MSNSPESFKGYRDVPAYIGHIQRLSLQVCKVALADGSSGTGFLVGPDIILTCYHTVPFNCPLDSISVEFAAGLKFSVIKRHQDSKASEYDRLPQFSLTEGLQPSTDTLDYCLLRLSSSPGLEVIEEMPDRHPWLRGWVELAQSAPPEENTVLTFFHHSEDPETGVLVTNNAGRTRLQHTAKLAPGWSGSPGFDPSSRLVALHHREGKKPHGIPANTIFQSLKDEAREFLTCPNPELAEVTALENMFDENVTVPRADWLHRVKTCREAICEVCGCSSPIGGILVAPTVALVPFLFLEQVKKDGVDPRNLEIKTELGESRLADNWHIDSVAYEQSPDKPGYALLRLAREIPGCMPLGQREWRASWDNCIVLTPAGIPSRANSRAVGFKVKLLGETTPDIGSACFDVDLNLLGLVATHDGMLSPIYWVFSLLERSLLRWELGENRKMALKQRALNRNLIQEMEKLITEANQPGRFIYEETGIFPAQLLSELKALGEDFENLSDVQNLRPGLCQLWRQGKVVCDSKDWQGCYSLGGL